MATWVETTFAVDLQASLSAVESALAHLEGYPGMGPAEFDSGRHVAHLRYDGTHFDRPALFHLIARLELPLIPEPLSTPAAKSLSR